MSRESLKCLSLSLCLLCAAHVAAEEPNVVAIDKEPRHRLAFESKNVRVFDTRIPSGETTLYHRHERDSVYVLISGTSDLVTEQIGKPPKPFSANPGDVFFGEHSKAPLTHRFSNLSAEEHHVLDIELIAETASSSVLLTALPAGHQRVVENPRVRVSRFVLEPGDSFRDDAAAVSGVLVVLAGSRVGVWGESAEMRENDTGPGWFHEHKESTPRQIENIGQDRLELIEVEIK
jgi:mannose-6-phosphate isomerase-like protein (cupin superfamily)